jgi:3-dehydroquinate dehydratase
MPSPSQALVTLRPDLARSFEQYDLAMSQAGFVMHDILPAIETQQAAGNYGIIPIEQLLSDSNTLRSPGANYNRQRYTFKPGTFATQEYGFEEPVDDNEAQLYANYLDAEQKAALRARDKVLRAAEKRGIDLLTNTSTFTNTSVAVSWKTLASSTPTVDIEVAMQYIYTHAGLRPNVVVMDWVAFRNVRQATNIIDRVKYSGIDDPKNITTNILAQLWDVERVLVCGTQRNSGNDGAAVTLTQVWPSGTVGVYVVGKTDDFKEPCVGRTFHWGGDGSNIGGTVESYRDEPIRSNVIRVRQQVQESIIYSAMGYLLTGANT